VLNTSVFSTYGSLERIIMASKGEEGYDHLCKYESLVNCYDEN